MFRFGGWQMEDETLRKEGMMGERAIKIMITTRIKCGGRDRSIWGVGGRIYPLIFQVASPQSRHKAAPTAYN